MSREQTFARPLLRWVIPIIVVNEAAALAGWASRGPTPVAVPMKEVGPQTNDNPSPIFRCSGAGAGVVVSLGGDGSSVFVYCDEVKP